MLKYFYIKADLKKGDCTLPRALSRRTHRVLRMKKGQEIALFNGRDGLWRARLDSPADGQITILAQIKTQPDPAEGYLFLALAKKDAFDRAIRQATELGVSHIQPVHTDFSVVDKLNTERVKTITLEAAEQCERLHLPEVKDPLSLREAVCQFSGNLYWGDETRADAPFDGWDDTTGIGVLIGPEGGFSEEERAWLKDRANITPVGLGKTILKVDTAVCVALGLFNMAKNK